MGEKPGKRKVENSMNIPDLAHLLKAKVGKRISRGDIRRKKTHMQP